MLIIGKAHFVGFLTANRKDLGVDQWVNSLLIWTLDNLQNQSIFVVVDFELIGSHFDDHFLIISYVLLREVSFFSGFL